MHQNETEPSNRAGIAPKTGLEYRTHAACNCLPDSETTAVRFQAVDIRGELTPERFGELLENFLVVWPESYWPGFALRQADAIQSYTAW